MIVRAATGADVSAAAQVHHAAVTTAYRHIFPPDAPPPTIAELESDWAAAVADAGTTVLVGEVDGQVVGTVAVRGDELRRLHVAPDHWRRGYGGILHDAAVSVLAGASASVAHLWVLEGNTRARAMYERRGWRLVPGETLEWPGLGVIEVRYALAMAGGEGPERVPCIHG